MVSQLKIIFWYISRYFWEIKLILKLDKLLFRPFNKFVFFWVLKFIILYNLFAICFGFFIGIIKLGSFTILVESPTSVLTVKVLFIILSTNTFGKPSESDEVRQKMSKIWYISFISTDLGSKRITSFFKFLSCICFYSYTFCKLGSYCRMPHAAVTLVCVRNLY